jgi:putative acetyltransferase
VFLVGEVDGRAVADASVRRLGAMRVRHVASLGIGVHPAYQGIGLGRAMMEAAVAWAEDVGIERLELSVRGDNHRAIALYEAMGFERESLRPRFVKLKDGTYVDDWVMVRYLG